MTNACAGEYGELLLGDAGGARLSREYPTATAGSSTEVVDLLERVLQRPQLPAVAREFLLTALVKLSARFPDQNDRIQVGEGRLVLGLVWEAVSGLSGIRNVCKSRADVERQAQAGIQVSTGLLAGSCDRLPDLDLSLARS